MQAELMPAKIKIDPFARLFSPHPAADQVAIKAPRRRQSWTGKARWKGRFGGRGISRRRRCGVATVATHPSFTYRFNARLTAPSLVSLQPACSPHRLTVHLPAHILRYEQTLCRI